MFCGFILRSVFVDGQCAECRSVFRRVEFEPIECLSGEIAVLQVPLAHKGQRRSLDTPQRPYAASCGDGQRL